MTIECRQCNAQNRAKAKFCRGGSRTAPTPTGTRSAESFLADASKAVDKQVGRPLGSLLLGLICLIYLINPSAGVIELLPDVLPVVGNLDEGVATIGLVIALSNLGVISFENGRINFEGWTQLISSLRRQKPN